MRVLIVDDEIKIAEAIQVLLERNGFQTKIVESGSLAFFEASKGLYDLILLDVMMPEIDGFEVVKMLRKNGIFTPIMMITAKDETKDLVTGLELGANDYLTKPFSMEELLARVRVLTRSFEHNQQDVMEYRGLKLNTRNMMLSFQTADIKLSTLEFNMMCLFMTSPDTVYSKEDLNEKIWEGKVNQNHVETYISFLRKKLQRIASPVNLVTIRQLGYRLGS